MRRLESQIGTYQIHDNDLKCVNEKKKYHQKIEKCVALMVNYKTFTKRMESLLYRIVFNKSNESNEK